MCGIMGYKGNNDATSIVINGLKRLEYRGYDSWGVAIKNSGLEVIKKVGKIGQFSDRLPKSTIAIGHTRWATHGLVTEENSHPHTDCKGKIAVVHNGIIENYIELKDELKKKGHEFSSDTDSEVIPHLVEEYSRDNGLLEAARLALNRLEGNFAVVIIEEGSDIMLGARRGSPLVVGVKGKEVFMASDVPAFLEHTNSVMFLDDGEMAVANESLNVLDIVTGKEIKKEISTVKWDITQAQKGSYPHFMLKEIMEQGSSLRGTLNQDDALLQNASNLINSSKDIIMVACGTAYHASLVGACYFREVAGKRPTVVLGSEFDSEFIDEKTIVIAVSQSGETADVMGPVKAAKEKGAKILAIVNVQNSSLYRMADISLPINAGPEIAVASTKAFTSQVALLTLIAFSCANRLKEGRELIEDTAKKAADVLSKTNDDAKQLALSLPEKDMFFIGRGINYPIALEAALKVKEVSYIHAEGLAAGELKHGTLALIEKGTPCIVFFSNDKHKQDTIGNAAEIKARGGYIIGIGPENNSTFDKFINVPDASVASPLLNVVPAQLLTYHLGVKRGCEIDHCRNLAKSVTVK